MRWCKDYGIPIFAIKGEDNETYYAHINPRSTTSRTSPWTTARTWSRIASPSARTCSNDVIGGTEETTTGVIRLRAWQKKAC